MQVLAAFEREDRRHGDEDEGEGDRDSEDVEKSREGGETVEQEGTVFWSFQIQVVARGKVVVEVDEVVVVDEEEADLWGNENCGR